MKNGIKWWPLTHDDAVSSPVVGGSDGAEAFLSRRVPNLQFDAFSVDVYRFDFEVDADRRDIRAGEGIIGEA